MIPIFTSRIGFRRGLRTGTLGVGTFRIRTLGFGLRLVGTGSLLVRIASVIRLVEAGALENNSRPGSEQALDRTITVFLGAIGKPIVFHRLKHLELVTAFLTLVIVGRHSKSWFLPALSSTEIRAGDTMVRPTGSSIRFFAWRTFSKTPGSLAALAFDSARFNLLPHARTSLLRRT